MCVHWVSSAMVHSPFFVSLVVGPIESLISINSDTDSVDSVSDPLAVVGSSCENQKGRLIETRTIGTRRACVRFPFPSTIHCQVPSTSHAGSQRGSHCARALDSAPDAHVFITLCPPTPFFHCFPLKLPLRHSSNATTHRVGS